jgi:hypothetical protein
MTAAPSLKEAWAATWRAARYEPENDQFAVVHHVEQEVYAHHIDTGHPTVDSFRKTRYEANPDSGRTSLQRLTS